MKVRQRIPLLLLTLCLALLPSLSACESSSIGDSSQHRAPITPQEKEAKVRQAKDKLKDANADVARYEGELAEASKEATPLRDKASKLEKQAQDLIDQSIKSGKNVRNGKNVNFDDPKEAPATAPVRKKFRDADAAAKGAEAKAQEVGTQLQEARTRVTQATADLETAQKAVVTTAAGETGNPDKQPSGILANLAILFPTIVVALAALVLLGIFFWLTWRTINHAQTRTEELIRVVEKNRSREGAVALSGLEGIKTQLMDVTKDLARFSELAETERLQRLADKRQPVTYVPPVTPYYELPVEVEEDTPQFPTSASALLIRLGGQSPILKPDPLKGILIKDPEGRGQLVLMQNERMPGSQIYIVPRITRFQTKEDFYNHYEQFYDCNRPAAGEVWLHEPAPVEKVDGGWRLQNKGVLEIR
jgi:hypothetical protein